MHIDPDFSKIAGHKLPILHGLCTLGFSVRAILRQYAGNNASLFKAVKARFSKPVIPGQTLKIEMWKNQQRIHFKTSIVETGVEVITGAFVDLKSVVESAATSSSSVQLQSDAAFRKISDRIAEDPARAKQINAVFLYQITDGGKVAKQWSRCRNGSLERHVPQRLHFLSFQRLT